MAPRKVDTNHFKNKGSTDEECCVARSCSQQPGSSCAPTPSRHGCVFRDHQHASVKWRPQHIFIGWYTQWEQLCGCFFGIRDYPSFQASPNVWEHLYWDFVAACQRGVWEHGAIDALQGTQQSFQASSSILAEFTGSDWGNICRKPGFLPAMIGVSCRFSLNPI